MFNNTCFAPCPWGMISPALAVELTTVFASNINEMELKTKFLFNLLLRYLKPQAVCDIGSMDGADALRFARLLPESQIVIFEANPDNYRKIVHNLSVRARNIITCNEIVWNENDPRNFHLVKPSSVKGVDEHLRGMSSVFYRDTLEEQDCVELTGVRLDTKMSQIGSYESLALWIDVEGGAYEVLEGMSGIRDNVALIHAEVETREFWNGQKTRAQVLDLAERMGYQLLGHGRNKDQHDIVLVDKNVLDASPKRLRFLATLARLKALRVKRFFQHFSS